MKIKRPNLHGLNPRTFPAPIQHLVDQDYAHKLSLDEKLWLSAFNDAHYGADFRGTIGSKFDARQRKASNDAKNAARRDLTPQVDSMGMLESWDLKARE